jgi:hypothetical protein
MMRPISEANHGQSLCRTPFTFELGDSRVKRGKFRVLKGRRPRQQIKALKNDRRTFLQEIAECVLEKMASGKRVQSEKL